MKIGFPALRRSTWRDRFVEIAREAQAAQAARSWVIASGLRLRRRSSAFAAPRRVRPA
jgi:hypothetical protein